MFFTYSVITGSFKEVGGGLQLSTSGGFQLNRAALERHDLMSKGPLGRPARTINMVQLGRALTEVNDPPVKALMVYNSNPAAVTFTRDVAPVLGWAGAPQAAPAGPVR